MTAVHSTGLRSTATMARRLVDGPEDRIVRETWVEGFATDLRQTDEGVYVNFLSDEGAALVPAASPR
jgi:hypothetical protein